jgi:hypothetical protein
LVPVPLFVHAPFFEDSLPMTKKLKFVLAVSFGIYSLFSVSACTNSAESKPAITKTQHTIITPYLVAQIGIDNNILYCASFQMAWNKMRDKVIKGDIQLENEPLTAQRLNRMLENRNDISIGSFVAEAGELSDELVARINKQLQEKFGDQVGDTLEKPHDANGQRQLIAYAFLYKNLEFPTEFEKLKDTVAFAAGGRVTPVQAFGVDSFAHSKRLHKKLADQVAIFDYRNDDDFILVLTSKSDNDQIILAKVTPGRNLLNTYTTVAQRIGNAKQSYLQEEETLRIPKIDFDLTHSFSELENKRIKNKGWEGWFISKAVQDTRFKLDEKGAVLKSRSFLLMLKEEAPPPEEKPRKFIFDKPFLICLKQKNGIHPYFALWVNNPELLLTK